MTLTNIYAGRSSFSFAPVHVNFGLFPFKTGTVFPTWAYGPHSCRLFLPKHEKLENFMLVIRVSAGGSKTNFQNDLKVTCRNLDVHLMNSLRIRNENISVI